MKKIFFCFLFLSGCASAPAPVVQECPKPLVLNPPPIEAVTLKPVKFYVVSEKNLETFLKEIQDESSGVFYAVTPAGYQSLAHNVQELRRYIKESQNTILFYQKIDESIQ